MRLVLITQNEKMFLSKSIDYFLRRLNPSDEVVGVVVLETSPFGEQMSLFKKFTSTLNIFGYKFVFRYLINLIKITFTSNDLFDILKRNKINIIKLNGSINSNQSLDILTKLDADLFISIAGNQIFKKKLIDLPHHGTINLHTSLLPKYRGLMPSFWVLKNKEKQTGVTVFFVNEGIDSGPILVQKKLCLGELSQWRLIEMTKYLGIEALIESIDLIRSNNFTLIENNNSDATYFSFPSKQDVAVFKKNGGKFF